MMIEKAFPSILDVETGIAPQEAKSSPLWQGVIDYRIYDCWPNWWRDLERFLRMDFGLAYEVAKIAKNYQVLWLWSEKVFIPLSLFKVEQPMIVVCHNLGPVKRLLIKSLGLYANWSAVGYIADSDKEILIRMGVPENRLFRVISAPEDCLNLDVTQADGPIISLGVAHRDYKTLLLAFKKLPRYEIEIFTSSRYGDKLKSKINDISGDMGKIQIMNYLPRDGILHHYQSARFVVLPLFDSNQAGAGATVALEASASGKAIIASATRGMSTFIQDGITGLLIPPNSVEALAEAIQYLWDNPEVARRMGEAGRSFVEKEFNPLKINENIIEVVKKTCAISQ